MINWICKTCGTQYPASIQPPTACPICLDQRQYVGHEGQQWTTLDAMLKDGFHNVIREHEPNLIGIGSGPTFAIGQRALLLRTPQGNILWDCITLLDQPTIDEIERLGGVSAIAISHPHFYSSMITWADHFSAPIYLQEADRQWVMHPSERIIYWSGDTFPLLKNLTLIRLGGHFEGGTVLHWPAGDQQRGVLLTGDIIQVVANHNFVSFMYSYPNLIPLPASAVEHIRTTIEPYHFNRLYGAWFDRVVLSDAHEAVLRSADRYIQAINGTLPALPSSSMYQQ